MTLLNTLFDYYNHSEFKTGGEHRPCLALFRVAWRFIRHATPFKTNDGRQARFTQFVQRKTQGLQGRRNPLFAHPLPGLNRRRIAPDDLPTYRTIGQLNFFKLAPKFLPIGMHLAGRRRTHRRLQGYVDHLTNETLKILHMPQRAINARRRNLQPFVFNSIDFERKLQLAIDLFAVFYIDELRNGYNTIYWLDPGKINGNAQQTTGGALNLHQVIT